MPASLGDVKSSGEQAVMLKAIAVVSNIPPI